MRFACMHKKLIYNFFFDKFQKILNDLFQLFRYVEKFSGFFHNLKFFFCHFEAFFLTRILLWKKNSQKADKFY